MLTKDVSKLGNCTIHFRTSHGFDFASNWMDNINFLFEFSDVIIASEISDSIMIEFCYAISIDTKKINIDLSKNQFLLLVNK